MSYTSNQERVVKDRFQNVISEIDQLVVENEELGKYKEDHWRDELIDEVRADGIKLQEIRLEIIKMSRKHR